MREQVPPYRKVRYTKEKVKARKIFWRKFKKIVLELFFWSDMSW